MRTVTPENCSCADRTLPAVPQERAPAFYGRREHCPALKLTIPDSLLEKHCEFSTSPADSAYHCSVPLLAYCLGHLPEFTDLIHRYLLEGINYRSSLTSQYKSDIRETWVLESDSTARYRAARLYQSRIAELSFARWLERSGWEISSLEAYGGAFDVSAVSPAGQVVDFEIKFLAQREVVFELNRASFQSPVAGWLGMYSPIDYLLFRIYEAARQLARSNSTRIAVAIVKDYQVSYKIPLTENWIDWTNPTFLRRDSEIDAFLARQYEINQNLDIDLRRAIAEVDEVWILKDGEPFDLALAHQLKTQIK